MAIVKMKKFNLFVPNSHLDNVLRKLQIFRNIQFKKIENRDMVMENIKDNLNEADVEANIYYIEDEISKSEYITDSISKYKQHTPILKSMIDGLPNYTFKELEKIVSDIDFEQEYSKIKELCDELSKIESKISAKKDLYEEIKPLANLDLSLEDLSRIKKIRYYYRLCIQPIGRRIY